MLLHRAKQLLEGFGSSGYVDVLKGTSLERHGKDNGFGLYVVRGALQEEKQDNWAEQCYRMFDYKAHDIGGTKLGANKKHYSTVQAVLNECTCKYDYEGAAKHTLNHLWEGKDNGVCQVLLNSLEWVKHNLGLERSLLFNEVVANEYAHIKEEYTPWHSDTSPLLDDEGLIVSVTLGAPGVFCFAPFYGAESAREWFLKGEEKRKQCYKDMCSWMCCFVARGFDVHVWNLPEAYGTQNIENLSYQKSYAGRVPCDE